MHVVWPPVRTHTRPQATQMARPGYLPDSSRDRQIEPGPYQTADERERIVLRAVRCVQRWARGWLGRRRAAYLRACKQEREAFLRGQEQRAQRDAEEHRRREIQRRMHPRSAADFEVLYNELEAWRLQVGGGQWGMWGYAWPWGAEGAQPGAAWGGGEKVEWQEEVWGGGCAGGLG